MKHFFLILFSAFTIVCSAQKVTIIYIDEAGNEVEESSAAYERRYYKNDKKEYVVKDFYLDNSIYTSGKFADKKFTQPVGKFTWYYANGDLKMEGRHFKHMRFKEWSAWYENGQLKYKGTYSVSGMKKDLWQAWYPNGNLDYEGSYDRYGKTGEWSYYHPNGAIASKEIYENDSLISVKFWSDEGIQYAGPTEIESMPIYPGGEAALMEFIKSNLEFSNADSKGKNKDEVVVSFKVDKLGRTTDIRILNSSNPILEIATEDVLEKLALWTPGKFHNRTVPVELQIPITYIH